MEGVNKLEQAVLDKLLAGTDPALVVLRAQADSSRVRDREYTGVGFWTFFTVPDNAPNAQPPDFLLDDVVATMSGVAHGVGFSLLVKNGRLDMLEGFTYDQRWPDESNEFELTYTVEPRELRLVRLSLRSSRAD